MIIIKYFILFLILVASTLIGKSLSKKYVYRLQELEEIENSLNILKTKIKFTYEPIPELFNELEKSKVKNIGNIFCLAKEKMKEENISIAWEKAIDESVTNLKKEDKEILKTLGKLLGATDVEGQLGQIETTKTLLENQTKEAVEEKLKNEKLYSKLGTTIGLAIVVLLF